MLNQKRLKELLSYDPETGLFTWKVSFSSRARAGCSAGTINGSGYMRIMLDKKSYRSHGLAWLYVHGVWPDVIDHIDGVRHHNFISNLRDTTQSGNIQNFIKPTARNTSGFLGVSFHKGAGKYAAQIRDGDTRHFIGLFITAEEAS
jgi:hypothetical protein